MFINNDIASINGVKRDSNFNPISEAQKPKSVDDLTKAYNDNYERLKPIFSYPQIKSVMNNFREQLKNKDLTLEEVKCLFQEYKKYRENLLNPLVELISDLKKAESLFSEFNSLRTFLHYSLAFDQHINVHTSQLKVIFEERISKLESEKSLRISP